MKWLSFLLLILLTGCASPSPQPPVQAAGPPMPPTPPPVSPLSHTAKTRLRTMALAAAPRPAATMAMTAADPGQPVEPKLYHVNPWFTHGPVIMPTDGTNMLLYLPVGTPQLYIPNKSAADFAMLQSSPDLKTWTTLGYMTNFVNGFYIADITATNQPKYFYRLVPQ